MDKRIEERKEKTFWTIGQMSFASLMVLAVLPTAPFLMKAAVCTGCAWSANETLKRLTNRIPKAMRPTPAVEKSWWIVVGKGPKGIERYNLAGSVPHILIAGATGGGKSAFELWILYTLCSQQPPERLSIDIIDLKGGSTFAAWANVPHVKRICGKVSEAESVLRDAAKLMWERLDKIAQARRTFEDEPNFPHHFILIDEGSLLAKSDEALELFQEIAAIGREPRVHLIYATQRPENTVLPLIIRDQLGGRFCFKVDEVGTSEMVLGRNCFEAYELPNHPGRMVYRKPNGDKILVQAPFIPTHELVSWLRAFANKEEVSTDAPASLSFPAITDELEE